MNTVGVIHDGDRQIVELPYHFHLAGDEVSVRQNGNSIILEPIVDDWLWLDNLAGHVDDDFAYAVNEKLQEQKRPALGELFQSFGASLL